MNTLVPVGRRAVSQTCGIKGCLLFAWLLCIGNVAAEVAPASAPAAYSNAEVPLRVLNRDIFIFRANLGPYLPEQRAAAAAALIDKAQPKSGKATVESKIIGENIAITVNGQTVLNVTRADVNEIQGETLESVAQLTVHRLNVVLEELAELRDRRNLLLSALRGILITALYGGLIWLLSRNRRWAEGRLIRLTADKADRLKSHTLRLVGLQNVVPFLRGLMTAVFWFVIAAASYIWLDHLLRLFPFTRPLGEQLDARFSSLLWNFALNALRALPDLGIVLLIWALARFTTAAVRRFFAAVQRGTVKSHFFDPATAIISQRLCVFLIWLTAIIVAFPYIPGSHSPAFRGISVLAGLMISLGSSSLVTQIVSGLVIIYNRTCRAGDYVRIGDHEGTITSLGFFSSRMVTVRNEEVVIPNSHISSSTLVNYSRPDKGGGVALPVTITIGYNTPWRQVHAMMREAARRTQGVTQQPEPAVRQNSLSDFYVEYQLNAVVENPAQRIRILSDLHANIQDVFNEYGVQIMSPHYRSDPPQPVVVPKDKWHQPPAQPGT